MKPLALIALLLGALSVPVVAEPAKLPDGVVSTGQNDIATAWLTRPTKRYAHAILGDAIEAGGLAVKTRSGKVLELVLPKAFVFEDRIARVFDLDKDGRDEVLVVLTHRETGGALAVYGARDGKLKQLAQTPHIGRHNRWINPAEFSDLDGDGQIEITAVWKPHLARELQVWRYKAGKLSRVTSRQGYSNHEIYSRVQDLSETVTLKDGRRALAIATPGYDGIAFLVMHRGKLKEVARVKAGGKITSAIRAGKNGRQLEFATGQKKRAVSVP